LFSFSVRSEVSSHHDFILLLHRSYGFSFCFSFSDSLLPSCECLSRCVRRFLFVSSRHDEPLMLIHWIQPRSVLRYVHKRTREHDTLIHARLKSHMKTSRMTVEFDSSREITGQFVLLGCSQPGTRPLEEDLKLGTSQMMDIRLRMA